MTRSRRTRLALACLLVGLCGGCKNDDVDRLARIWHRVGDRVCTLTGGVRVRLTHGWTVLQEQSDSTAALRERVISRLKLDKQLAALCIEVEVAEAKVTLRGRIEDGTARQKAVELAQETVGVDEVIDEMGPKE